MDKVEINKGIKYMLDTIHGENLINRLSDIITELSQGCIEATELKGMCMLLGKIKELKNKE